MWLAFFLIIAAVLAVAGSIATAGAFAVVLLVIAIIAAIAGVGGFAFARRTKFMQMDAGVSETVMRVGGNDEQEDGRVPATPDELVDARRAAQ